MRCALASIGLDLARVKLEWALRRKYAGQPRVPAGNGRESGRYASGGAHRGPLLASRQPQRPRVGGTRTIGGENLPVTPAQAARLDITEAQARVLTREVQRQDPNWRPEPAIHEGVEGQIQANQAVARQAMERLRELGVSAPRAMSQEEALRPLGREIGWREPGAGPRIRTCRPGDFNTLLDSVSPGAQEVPSRGDFQGLWFKQPNGSVFGLRMSENYGMTYEVIRSNNPLLRAYKVHQK
jgi:hypothetical protein